MRSCFDSWACAKHILRSHKFIWVSALTFLTYWFITQLKNSLLLEVMFTIYLTLNREISRTSNRRENVYIFLTPLYASYNYSRNAKRVLQKPVRETHAPIERLGRDHSMVSSPEPLGLICNMATYLRRTEQVCSKLDLK